MIEIKKIPLSKLYKQEVPLLLSIVVDILRKHNPEAIRLGDLYELLQLQLVKAEVLTKSYGKHSLTIKLDKLHKKRLRYAALINLQLRSLEKVDSEEIRNMVENAQKLSKEFLTYLGQKRLLVVSFQIDAFFSQYRHEVNTVSREAFMGLGLQIYIDELQKTNKLYDTIHTQRALDIKSRPQVRDRKLEKETQKMMRLFFEQVNSYQDIFKDLNYQSLINDINVRLTEYSKVLKTRVATNKRRAKKKKALAEKEKADKMVKPQKITEAKAEIKSATNTVTLAEKSVEEKPMNDGSIGAKTKNTVRSMKKGKRKSGKRR